MTDLLGPDPGSAARRLRQRLTDPTPLLLPGCYDGLGARLIEQAGFDAAYLTGFGTSASLLGRPDVGLLGLAEMADTVRRVVAATDLPIIADADTGYGNAVNVIRTVREYERAGVAGLHIEDQVMPKRCGHMAGKEVVPTDEWLAKIRAAVAARRSPDLVVIARTDARAPLGLEEALDRAERAADAGADALFVEALADESEIEAAATRLAGTPLVYNWVDGGRSPAIPMDRLAELGFRIVLAPVTLLLAAAAAIGDRLRTIAAAGHPYDGSPQGFDWFNGLIGLDEVDELDRRFRAT